MTGPDLRNESWAKKLNDSDPQKKKTALKSLYDSYHPVLWALGRTRTDDPRFLKEVLKNFWRMMARGEFAPAPDEARSPLAYLLAVFHRFLAENKQSRGIGDWPALTESDIEEIYSGKLTAEEKERKRSRRQVLGRALAILGEIAPLDAHLSFQYLSGADLGRIVSSGAATAAISGENKNADQESAIKKRLLDTRSGALARLKILLDRFHARRQDPALHDSP